MLDPKDIELALSKDKDLQAGVKAYHSLDEKAMAVSQEITKAMIENIVKEESEFNITMAVLAVSKSLIELASFLYDSEEEFLVAMKKSRTTIVSDIIPALLDPEPCGLCESCKNGKPEECVQPKIRQDYTQSRFLPLVCGSLIEYDLFNKVLHMYTVGKEKGFDVASQEQSKEE